MSKFIERNGLLVPESLPDEIGFGCPKCDKALFVPTLIGQNNPDLSKFMKAHMACGELEGLELRWTDKAKGQKEIRIKGILQR